MKLSTLALTLALATAGFAAEEPTANQQKIKAMIQEIKLSGEGDRYQKMNAFKEQLRTMNAENRQAAINELQTTLAEGDQLQTQTRTRTQTRTNEGTGEGEQVQTRTQTRNESHNEMMQMQQTQQQIQLQTQMQSQKQTKTMNGTMPNPQNPGHAPLH